MDPLLESILRSRPEALMSEGRPEWARGSERVGGFQSVSSPEVSNRRFAAPTVREAEKNLEKTFLESATPDVLSKLSKFLHEIGASTVKARAAGEIDPLGPLNLVPFGGPAIGAAGVIAGRRGALQAGKGAWFDAAVKKAEAMERQGAPSQEIWRKLGLEREKGGTWTWEIPDDAARITPAAQEVLAGGKSLTGVPYSSVYEHPEMFRAYPTLADLPVNVGRGARGGSYRPTIAEEGGEIAAIAQDPAMMLRVLTHEGQHGIQELEKLPMGGSPATVSQGEIALARSRPLSVEDLKDPVTTAYMRRAGETQARNAEARLVDEDLRKMAPGLTEDVPRMLQTIRYLQDTSPQLAVKEKGGMWHPEAVERLAGPLAERLGGGRERIEFLHRLPREAGLGNLDMLKKQAAEMEPSTQWSQRAIRNYLNKHAGTTTDPLKDVEIPFGEGVKRWEELTDQAIKGHTKEQLESPAGVDPWGARDYLQDIRPGETVWRLDSTSGFPQGQPLQAIKSYLSHVGDYLRQNVSPEKLQQYDLVRAVKETAANDARVAKEMEKAAAASMKDLPVYKDYSTQNPGSLPGMKWVELRVPEKLTALQMKGVEHLRDYKLRRGDQPSRYDEAYYIATDAHGKPIVNSYTGERASGRTPEEAYLAGQLAQEGNQMGHCVGGYCEGVAAGESRIFSLRDAKGKSHVTIEVNPRLGEDQVNMGGGQWKDIATPDILQIKGKQNRAPNAEYLPYVQDFVKSGKWGEVGDLGNTGLVDVGNRQFMTLEEAKAAGYRTNAERNRDAN